MASDSRKLLVPFGMALAVVLVCNISRGTADDGVSPVGRWKPSKPEPGKTLDYYVFRRDGTGSSQVVSEEGKLLNEHAMTWKQSGNSITWTLTQFNQTYTYELYDHGRRLKYHSKSQNLTVHYERE
jgi:hypothetical protein